MSDEEWYGGKYYQKNLGGFHTMEYTEHAPVHSQYRPHTMYVHTV